MSFILLIGIGILSMTITDPEAEIAVAEAKIAEVTAPSCDGVQIPLPFKPRPLTPIDPELPLKQRICILSHYLTYLNAILDALELWKKRVESECCSDLGWDYDCLRNPYDDADQSERDAWDAFKEGRDGCVGTS